MASNHLPIPVQYSVALGALAEWRRASVAPTTADAAAAWALAESVLAIPRQVLWKLSPTLVTQAYSIVTSRARETRECAPAPPAPIECVAAVNFATTLDYLPLDDALALMRCSRRLRTRVYEPGAIRHLRLPTARERVLALEWLVPATWAAAHTLELSRDHPRAPHPQLVARLALAGAQLRRLHLAGCVYVARSGDDVTPNSPARLPGALPVPGALLPVSTASSSSSSPSSSPYAPIARLESLSLEASSQLLSELAPRVLCGVRELALTVYASLFGEAEHAERHVREFLLGAMPATLESLALRLPAHVNPVRATTRLLPTLRALWLENEQVAALDLPAAPVLRQLTLRGSFLLDVSRYPLLEELSLGATTHYRTARSLVSAADRELHMPEVADAGCAARPVLRVLAVIDPVSVRTGERLKPYCSALQCLRWTVSGPNSANPKMAPVWPPFGASEDLTFDFYEPLRLSRVAQYVRDLLLCSAAKRYCFILHNWGDTLQEKLAESAPPTLASEVAICYTFLHQPHSFKVGATMWKFATAPSSSPYLSAFQFARVMM